MMQMRTSHLEIRKKILEEKSKVSDEELFASPAFAAYLSDIGETVIISPWEEHMGRENGYFTKEDVIWING